MVISAEYDFFHPLIDCIVHKNHIILMVDLDHTLIKMSLGGKVAAELGHIKTIGFTHNGKAKLRESTNEVFEEHFFSAECTCVPGKIQQIDIAEVPSYIVKLYMTVDLTVGLTCFNYSRLCPHHNIITGNIKGKDIHIMQAIWGMNI